MQNFKPKRLTFLRTFITMMGATIGDVASQLGVSPVTIGYWFHHDNTNLSRIRTVLELFGYSLCISLRDPKLDKSQRVFPWRSYEHLPFLSSSMSQLGINKKELARLLKITPSAVHHMMQCNDMSLARLLQIADVLHLSLQFHIRPRPLSDRNPFSVTFENIPFA